MIWTSRLNFSLLCSEKRPFWHASEVFESYDLLLTEAFCEPCWFSYRLFLRDRCTYWRASYIWSDVELPGCPFMSRACFMSWWSLSAAASLGEAEM